MRHLLFLLPLLALTLSGCRGFIAEDPQTHVRLMAFGILTSPKFGHATVTVKKNGVDESIDVADYASASNVTGADLATIGAIILKAVMVVP